MGAKSDKQNFLEILSSGICCQYNPQYTLKHKKAWINLIDYGHLPCDPIVIYNKFKELILFEKYQPRGKKLLCLCPRDKFTLLPSGKPKRPEEALERLIVYANLGHMYGQMPIGGRKESVDIVKLKNDTGTFIELKPWRSKNSPLYALLEGLKNLFLYRILKKNNHRGCKIIQNVRLAILAPFEYYQDYHILDGDFQLYNSKNIQKFFDAISKVFDIDIQILALDWSEENLWKVCSDILPRPPIVKKIISVAAYPGIAPLKEKNWVTLMSAGKQR